MLAPLRFITCGSVDDGKSTLLGRLLHDAGMLADDQLESLRRDSARRHGGDATPDFALLLDGLDAERQQGITIDVAWRYFRTALRSFIVADCPGHEQYTRNMITGASRARLALVLVDASRGVLRQTRRHTYLCALLGIRRIVLVVNKMDRVGFDAAVFDAIAQEYRQLATDLGIASVDAVPVVATAGDHIASASTRMPWYRGPCLLGLLETIEADDDVPTAFRLPVQWVNRIDAATRGYAGTVRGGRIGVGEEVRVQPGGQHARIARLIGAAGEVGTVSSGQAVQLCLDRELDVSRGSVISPGGDPAPVADQFASHLVWMGDAPLLPGRRYLCQLGCATALARITLIKHRIDVDTQAQLAARRLQLNDVGYVHLELDRPLAYERYVDNRDLGGFILIDRHSHATVAAGMLDFALRRAANIHWQHTDVDQLARAAAKGQRPQCLWFTGLSGAGKSTVANRIERQLAALGHHTYLLDGDNLRHGLNVDLGFTAEDRVENVRRVAEVARLMVDAGLIVLVCVISPFQSEREFARSRFAPDAFVEVFVDTPLAECERRDPKGLYRKARAGELRNFTGIDSPYEPPVQADVHLHGGERSADQMVDEVLRHLRLE